MLLDRRRFVSFSALALGGITVSGCATTMARPTASLPTGCLPPVKVSAGRVIRTMAGLRPDRASGFVVRSQAHGDQRLVQTYGHGGGGIPLSWGQSKPGTEPGLPSHHAPAAVTGAGIMGHPPPRLRPD